MKYIGVFLLCGLLLWTTPAAAAQLSLSVAASLTDAVGELIEIYHQDHPELEFLPSFASSGALARQIVAGAPADLFISANPQWMDYLEEQNLIAEKTRQALVENRLVFVGIPEHPVESLPDIAQLSRIAICTPSASPAGKYAEAALISAGLHAQLTGERRLITAKDVRQALLYAERGEVDGAFIYQTDALAARQAEILFTVPQELYPQIIYPAALTGTGAEKQAVKAFFAFLFSTEAQGVLHRYGFLLPGQDSDAEPLTQ
ncbi:MAG: molybdate ABC transporter substrate-binding protein [Geoalkalibacter sp.]|uniref:molybdate ABC transporter substrate-binding protein n=1 Tax=Geoalkalibacter sp. TaxID=3041440 RepID=UPI002AA01162|nr:molybdate ABC transporter substrate-binding protein [Thermodesulfobacteriota bacterium]